MTKEEIFAAWAQDAAPWSDWVKPVVFAHLNLARGLDSPIETSANVDWSPPSSGKIALVIDLPGAQSVMLGVALAQRGYQPVPLFNALPLPVYKPFPDDVTDVAAVDVFPILDALKLGAELLRELKFSTDAPPVFLLDANRHGGRSLHPGDFDNRSTSFATDFPSENFLDAMGIRRALLIQKDSLEPKADLSHSLYPWQKAGIRFERMKLDPVTTPEPFEPAQPTWFQRALAWTGLRRGPRAGFGAWVPDSPHGG